MHRLQIIQRMMAASMVYYLYDRLLVNNVLYHVHILQVLMQIMMRFCVPVIL